MGRGLRGREFWSFSSCEDGRDRRGGASLLLHRGPLARRYAAAELFAAGARVGGVGLFTLSETGVALPGLDGVGSGPTVFSFERQTRRLHFACDSPPCDPLC